MCICLPTAVEIDTIDHPAPGRTTIRRKTYGLNPGSMSTVDSVSSWEEKPRIRFGTTKIWHDSTPPVRIHNPARLLTSSSSYTSPSYTSPKRRPQRTHVVHTTAPLRIEEAGPTTGMAGFFGDGEEVEVVDAEPEPEQGGYISSFLGRRSAAPKVTEVTHVRVASPTRSRVPENVKRVTTTTATGPGHRKGGIAAKKALFEEKSKAVPSGVRYGVGPIGRR